MDKYNCALSLEACYKKRGLNVKEEMDIIKTYEPRIQLLFEWCKIYTGHKLPFKEGLYNDN